MDFNIRNPVAGHSSHIDEKAQAWGGFDPDIYTYLCDVNRLEQFADYANNTQELAERLEPFLDNAKVAFEALETSTVSLTTFNTTVGTLAPQTYVDTHLAGQIIETALRVDQSIPVFNVASNEYVHQSITEIQAPVVASITALSTQVGTNASNITALSNTVTTNSSNILNLTNDVTGLSTSVSNLTTTVNSILPTFDGTDEGDVLGIKSGVLSWVNLPSGGSGAVDTFSTTVVTTDKVWLGTPVHRIVFTSTLLGSSELVMPLPHNVTADTIINLYGVFYSTSPVGSYPIPFCNSANGAGPISLYADSAHINTVGMANYGPGTLNIVMEYAAPDYTSAPYYTITVTPNTQTVQFDSSSNLVPSSFSLDVVITPFNGYNINTTTLTFPEIVTYNNAFRLYINGVDFISVPGATQNDPQPPAAGKWTLTSPPQQFTLTAVGNATQDWGLTTWQNVAITGDDGSGTIVTSNNFSVVMP